MKPSDYMAKNRENEITVKNNLESYKPLNIAILRSYTCEMLEHILKCRLFEEGFYAHVNFGGYNQFFQEIMDRKSFIYNDSDVILLLLRLEDFYPVFIADYYKEQINIEHHINTVVSMINEMLRTLTEKTSGKILFTLFAKPQMPPFGIHHAQTIDGIQNVIHRINLEIIRLRRHYPNAFFIDLTDVFLQLGMQNVYDLKMWQLSKNPYTFIFYEELSKLLITYILANFNARKKCIVLDLDDTLWKGILGETGATGIKPYAGFQQQLLYLKQTGIILAICSKNNEADVQEAFLKNPAMPLSLDDFAITKINWDNKAKNIAEIAEELSIGLDSIIFMDDNPAECLLVENILHEVAVYNVPKDIELRPDFIYGIKHLEVLDITEEDFAKTNMYHANAKRKETQQAFTNIDDYLKSLVMTMEIAPISEDNISRIAQLTNKTNQFNLTTKRYTAEDLKNMENEGYLIYGGTLFDVFGDNGLTAVFILKVEKDIALIDTFLLSCRVMGRGFEYAIMDVIVEICKEMGIKCIKGQFIKTAKNKPVEHLYDKFGFKKINETDFSIDIDEIKIPQYFIEL